MKTKIIYDLITTFMLMLKGRNPEYFGKITTFFTCGTFGTLEIENCFFI